MPSPWTNEWVSEWTNSQILVNSNGSHYLNPNNSPSSRNSLVHKMGAQWPSWGAQKHFSTNNLAPLHCGRVTLRCVFCVFLQNFFERSYSSHPHDIYLLPFLVPSLLGTTSLPSITSLPYQSFQNLLNKPLSFESLSQPAQGGTQTNLQTFCLLSIRITKMLTE